MPIYIDVVDRLVRGKIMRRSYNTRAFLVKLAIVALMSVSLSATHAGPIPVAGPRSISSGYFDPNYPPSQDRQHLGIDILAPVGAAVYAPVEGDVVIDHTGAPDIMQAYLVIHARNGFEHVLGHITSTVRRGAHVRAGQQVGIIRAWPGQPARSHVHWGVNRFGVAQAIRGDWGWGRAPMTATKVDAAARGWIAPLFSTEVAQAGQQRRPTTYPRDPINFCRAVVNSRSGYTEGGIADERYAGPDVPVWMLKAMNAGDATASSVNWRCAGSRVLACKFLGAHSCNFYVDARIATKEMITFCLQQPNSDFIPYAVTGDSLIYEWRCTGIRPSIIKRVGRAGYVPKEWRDVTVEGFDSK